MKKPNIEFPFVDAIKVIVKVNMQQNMDFLTKMAEAIAKPINNMTNNFS
jgi:hypothetical protein